MDFKDKQLLQLIQNNANISLSLIKKKTGLSSTACWNRIKKLEEDKIIEKRVTILNRKKLNLDILVFLFISVSKHTKMWNKNFFEVIQNYDEIVEVHRLTGDSSDYVLKVLASSIKDYDDFQQKLISEIEFTKMSSSISLQELKQTYVLPLKKI